MDEALLDVNKNEIEIVKRVLQQVYDNLKWLLFAAQCTERTRVRRKRKHNSSTKVGST